jgi:type III secretion system low calcium response chaperone LcrH/SycD
MTPSTPTVDFDQLTDDQLITVIDAFLNKGLALQDLKGIPDASMEAVYGMAYNLYNGGRFQDAETLFKYLTVLNHWEKKYWMGLGGARQVLGNYQEAIEAYAMATLIDMMNPMPHFQAAICHLGLGNIQEAQVALECVLEVVKDGDPIKAKAQGLMDTLKQPAKA